MPTVEQRVAELQQTNSELVIASDELTNEVTSKLSTINSTVAAKMGEVDSQITNKLTQIDTQVAQREQTLDTYLNNAQSPSVQTLGFAHSSGAVDADAQWHPIITGLNGHFLGELILQTNLSGYHSVGLFTVAYTFASGQIHARTSGPGQSTDLECRVVGTTYDYAIEIRTTSVASEVQAINSNENSLHWALMRYNLTI